ncbi:MAG TPA: MFS transporter [Solirubrobacterales bacterium]|jgi:MFS family permease|nr:MFS transporter [Solirubrobacterales bacterium]
MDRATRKLRLVVHALAIHLDDPDRGRLGVARILTSFSAWCFAIALGVYGFEAHGVVGVGLVALIRYLPGALAAPIAGVMIDRHSRRTVLVGSAALMFLILAGAATAAALGAPTALVFVFPGLYAIASAPYTPAESSLSPLLVETPQQLSAGNVNHAAMENGGSLIGAIVTGLLLTATSPAFVFALAAGAAAIAMVLLFGLVHDRRPAYIQPESEVAGAGHEIIVGLRTLAAHPALRLAWLSTALLFLFEGFAEVIVVGLALHQLHLAEGSVGFLNAAWGVGAIVGGAGLVLLLDRGRLVIAIAGGSLVLGLATMLPGLWAVPFGAYAGWFGIGIGFVFVEVAAKTLMQRLGDDEQMGRLLTLLESGRLVAMALGSLCAILLDELLGTRVALIVAGAMMPVFVVLCWAPLRSYEVGAPVAEVPYRLLRHNSIFEPLPIATLERLSHDLTPIEFDAGVDVIVQGEQGDRFYLIESGQVEVFEHGEFRRHEGPGESFGEIALLHQVPRTATVRTTESTRLLELEREQFLVAVTGHRRSSQVAQGVVSDRWDDEEATG